MVRGCQKKRTVFRKLGICSFPAYVNCNAMVVLHNCAKIYVLDLQFTYDKKRKVELIRKSSSVQFLALRYKNSPCWRNFSAFIRIAVIIHVMFDYLALQFLAAWESWALRKNSNSTNENMDGCANALAMYCHQLKIGDPFSSEHLQRQIIALSNCDGFFEKSN